MKIEEIGSCIENGHDFVFDGSEDIVRKSLGVDVAIDYRWAVIKKRCVRCGYTKKEMASGKEMRALKKLRIVSERPQDNLSTLNPPTTDDTIDCPPMPPVKPPRPEPVEIVEGQL